MPAKIAGFLQGPNGRTVLNVISIENSSEHGARVITHRFWQPHDHVTLMEVIGDSSVDAEVVYCQRLNDEKYAIGLKFKKRRDVYKPD